MFVISVIRTIVEPRENAAFSTPSINTLSWAASLVILTLSGFAEEGGKGATNLVPTASVIGLLGSSSTMGASNWGGSALAKIKP